MKDLDCTVFNGYPGDIEGEINKWLREDKSVVFSVTQSSMPDGTIAVTIFYQVSA